MVNKNNFLENIKNKKEEIFKDISKDNDNENLINFLDIFNKFIKNTNDIIKLVNGDITKILEVKAIVNAANTSLETGGGVCGTIFRLKF